MAGTAKVWVRRPGTTTTSSEPAMMVGSVFEACATPGRF
jgi:hypothetical protein